MALNRLVLELVLHGDCGLVMDFMIIFLDSVRAVSFQAESFRIVCLFVRSVVFPVVVNHGMHGSESAPSFSNDRANGHHSTHSITTKFLSAEARFMFGIGMLLPGPVSLHPFADTVNSESASPPHRPCPRGFLPFLRSFLRWII